VVNFFSIVSSEASGFRVYRILSFLYSSWNIRETSLKNSYSGCEASPARVAVHCQSRLPSGRATHHIWAINCTYICKALNKYCLPYCLFLLFKILFCNKALLATATGSRYIQQMFTAVIRILYILASRIRSQAQLLIPKQSNTIPNYLTLKLLLKPGMPIRIILMRIWINLFTLMRFHLRFHFELRASIVSVHGPPRLHFEPLKLLNFLNLFQIRIQLCTLMRIRIKFPKKMRIRIGIWNPDPDQGGQKCPTFLK
jgi:hypothetical protein